MKDWKNKGNASNENRTRLLIMERDGEMRRNKTKETRRIGIYTSTYLRAWPIIALTLITSFEAHLKHASLQRRKMDLGASVSAPRWIYRTGVVWDTINKASLEELRNETNSAGYVLANFGKAWELPRLYVRFRYRGQRHNIHNWIQKSGYRNSDKRLW